MTTNKKNWVNGHQVRGGWFNTFTFSIFNFGIMLIWGIEPKNNRFTYNGKKFIGKVNFYHLI